jgi:positive regulator of sigma E activity
VRARLRGLIPEAIVALVILLVFIVVSGALNLTNDLQRIGTLIVGVTAAVIMARRSAERDANTSRRDQQ